MGPPSVGTLTSLLLSSISASSTRFISCFCNVWGLFFFLLIQALPTDFDLWNSHDMILFIILILINNIAGSVNAGELFLELQGGTLPASD